LLWGAGSKIRVAGSKGHHSNGGFVISAKAHIERKNYYNYFRK